MTREQLDDALAAVLRVAREAAEELREGRLEARPDTCAWGGRGCAYPSICRCEGT